MTPPPAWRLLAHSEKGVAKKYSQDRHRATALHDGRSLVLAAADGHGSAAHFRSDLGARWAVEVFTDCAAVFATEAMRPERAGGRGWNALHEAALALPRQVVRAWRQRIALHESNSPADGRQGRHHGAPGPASAAPAYTVYGSTLLGAVLTPELLVCWQLGDGDITLVPHHGPPRTLLDNGRPDLGDETTSLCLDQAWHHMLVHWEPLTGRELPPFVLLTTDGLAKSFADRQGFLDFATGVRDRVVTDGAEAVRGQLPHWLGQAAAHSGDDTTLIVAFPADEKGRQA
ncbi:protein phosphatase 2C domain-containing protein [Streptomyces sp. YIM 98790]|uniref:protein phosphatase 2C domain-containing protein n=1 Tax=Streptomyces sp. YIM 98790 TaxID=2689077 RepID=UPI00140880F1|nr:protein phosphatase 2C domain-containing protein [Streptomyces sp. YIM 98790]